MNYAVYNQNIQTFALLNWYNKAIAVSHATRLTYLLYHRLEVNLTSDFDFVCTRYALRYCGESNSLLCQLKLMRTPKC